MKTKKLVFNFIFIWHRFPQYRCFSNVGRKGGKQWLSLEDKCLNNKLKTVKHELMHAMGFYHEQSRTDRDEHVIIHFDNIDNSGNFLKNFKPHF